jgi:hypothetical protein
MAESRDGAQIYPEISRNVQIYPDMGSEDTHLRGIPCQYLAGEGPAMVAKICPAIYVLI